MNMPKLSVVTVCFDNPDELRLTLNSIGNNENIEVIVVDGSESEDVSKLIVVEFLTLEIILISESDDGIYDAMNKGLDRAVGEYVIFMNSGDYFKEGVVSLFLKANVDSNSVYYGNTDFYENKKFQFHFESLLTSPTSFMKHNSFSHQAIFYPTKGIKKLDGYKLIYEISADFDLTFRLFNSGVKFTKLESVIACCELGGVSCQNGVQSYIDRMFVFKNENYLVFFISLLIYFPIFYFKNKAVSVFQGSKILRIYRKFKGGVLRNG
jgi:putative colanic acid biosynthesis glycosyltransferase